MAGRRETSVLSKPDREYLNSDEDFTRQHRYNRRESIEAGINKALEDFEILLDADSAKLDNIDPVIKSEKLIPAVAFLAELASQTEDVFFPDVVDAAKDRAPNYPHPSSITSVIEKLIDGRDLTENEYKKIVEHLEEDSQAFEAIISDENLHGNVYKQKMLLQEKEISELWEPLLIISNRPYDEETLRQLESRTRRAKRWRRIETALPPGEEISEGKSGADLGLVDTDETESE